MLKFVDPEHPEPASHNVSPSPYKWFNSGTEILQDVEREATLFVPPGGQAFSSVKPINSSRPKTTQRSSFHR